MECLCQYFQCKHSLGPYKGFVGLAESQNTNITSSHLCVCVCVCAYLCNENKSDMLSWVLAGVEMPPRCTHLLSIA